MNISQELKQLRIKQGITLQEMAEKLEVTKQAVCSLENPNSSPSINTIEKYCKAIGMEFAIKFKKTK